ncbi:MAG: HAMP domain-containing histidine kinase [Planctomycetales bacterium]|nr:HAMP domain-containing histidine kinase [Planctomycetales bacterium]
MEEVVDDNFSGDITMRGLESGKEAPARTTTWGRRWSIPLLLAVWAAFVGWQWIGHRHERALMEESLQQQSRTVMTALIGGAQSHRRYGQFFFDQLQGMLDALASSGDVLAARVTSTEGAQSLSAGDRQLIETFGQDDVGAPPAFRYDETFQLEDGSYGPPQGQGRGFGRGGRFRSREESDASLDVSGQEFHATLWIDRSRTDALIQHSAAAHVWVSAAGAAVVVMIAWAWRANVEKVAAEGRTQLWENEARHLRNLSQAAAGLAHETKNPLGLIRGWTQRLAHAKIDEDERRTQAQSVMEECDRVTARINQFLAFARPHNPQPTEVDVERLTAELANLLQLDLEAKEAKLEANCDPLCRTIRADRELLRQALFNLLQNAIAFSPTGGTVEASCVGLPHNAWRIEIADSGPGVGTDDVDRLFTPYFTTRHDGTGLGLAIVEQIAHAHGWRNGYAAREQGGATFWLEGRNA